MRNINFGLPKSNAMKLYILLSAYLISLTLYSQNTAGLITDSTQNPIPYATISIKNTNKGCFSDVDGRFALEQKLNPDDTITISCIGFETKMVSGKDIELPLKVTLNQSNHSIKAVTIEAYKRKLIKVKDKKRAHCMTRLSKGMEIVSYITVPKGGTIDEVVFYCMRDNSTKVVEFEFMK